MCGWRVLWICSFSKVRLSCWIFTARACSVSVMLFHSVVSSWEYLGVVGVRVWARISSGALCAVQRFLMCVWISSSVCVRVCLFACDFRIVRAEVESDAGSRPMCIRCPRVRFVRAVCAWIHGMSRCELARGVRDLSSGCGAMVGIGRCVWKVRSSGVACVGG